MDKDPLDEQRLGKKRKKAKPKWQVTVIFKTFGEWAWDKYYVREVDARKAYDKYQRDGKTVLIKEIL